MKHIRSLTIVLIACSVISIPAGGRCDVEELSVPAETAFRLELLSPISTEKNKKGDKFNCLVMEPEDFKGAIVTGHISKIKASRKANKKSEIALDFDLITMGEREGKFEAEVTEVYDVIDAAKEGRADEEGTVKGKGVRKRAIKASIAGAIIGGIIGGILGGGKGAAMGAAIGAGAGVATTLSMDAPELEFEAGTQFAVKTRGRAR
jgi:uncharacterized protein YcfJ